MNKSFTIHDLPADERPRERLVKLGEQALSAQELLQLILGRGAAGESVTVTAQKFMMTNYFFAEELVEKEFGIEFPKKDCGKEIMAVYVDIYGNEFREIFKVK
ncbi:MAG: hypothetical protein KKC11_09275 [Candidatus Omnitrophica bacterium]|nr:hypothetical protein [Candidatus Omnitrophota bacterium]MBU0878629.1 hypothetical protein [Candidatus Omnitrophota bacterium]MBU0897329.1 hypothetical protein [Candidatus Omnitrophota bacterium]MBU1133686.1 hypothetical protein [Candidatus Omnitrophota bacterium]MBU1366259.1 hypothetical protein [Candidatus Omnitrophota bacterium]